MELGGQTVTYGASLIKRRRRTKAEMEEIKSSIYNVVAADRPMTVRQVFYRLVVTLSRCIPGGNENAPEVMTEAVNTLDRIRERLNATVIVIHHSPLSDKDRPRGHSSLFAAADTAITIEQVGDLRTAALKYQRDGEEGQRFPFCLQQIEVGMDKHLRPITSCAVVPSEQDISSRPGPHSGAAFHSWPCPSLPTQ
jgi:hypothetical protein